MPVSLPDGLLDLLRRPSPCFGGTSAARLLVTIEADSVHAPRG